MLLPSENDMSCPHGFSTELACPECRPDIELTMNNDNLLEPLSDDARDAVKLCEGQFNHGAASEPLPLHKQLKAAREAKGISLRKLGELSGICFSQLWKYEKGRVSPNISTLERIGEILGFELCLKQPNKSGLTD